MKHVKFLPWQGSHYAGGFCGIRTLVLGESHYQWNCGRDINDWREVTQTLVQEQIDGDYSKAFWTKIAITFLNHAPSLEEKRRFWSSVAFYNYVQESVGDGPRIAPSNGSWLASADAFFTILNALRPQFVLVLGRRLWMRLPAMQCVRTEGADPRWTYRYEGGSALVYGVPHPSTGFNGRKWHDQVLSVLQKAESGR